MALFKRKNNDTDVLPEEVRDYYKSEQRSRTGKAWLLAILTLVVTFLIAAALFFGGRWVYRTVFSNDDIPTGQTETKNVDEASEESTKNTDQQTSSTNTTVSPNTPSATGSTPATTGTPAAPTTGSTGTTGNTTAPTVPNTGPNELVNTGPGDE